MSKHLERDLDSLEERLLAMSSRVEEMIKLACGVLIQGKVADVVAVSEGELEVDAMEVHVENECLKLLALHQPVAGDLRRITTLLKINNELERIADLAVNITERAVAIAETPEFTLPGGLQEMADKAVWLVHTSLDSFVEQSASVARAVRLADDSIDQLNREVIERLTLQMRQHPEQVGAALHCFSASRHIERIGDHATNIAEDVLYLVEGEIVRHRHEELPASSESTRH